MPHFSWSMRYDGLLVWENQTSFLPADLPQLVIFLVTIRIAFSFFGEVALHGIFEVDACLVCEADDDKEHIRQFVGELLVAVAGFEALIAILAGDDAGDFTDLFGEHGHIGQFREIAHAIVLDPLVDGALGFF